MGRSSRTAGEVTGPDAAENTSGRRTSLKSGTILVCTGAWDKLLDNDEIMGADADRPYCMHCRFWQTMDMTRRPEVEEIIYPLDTLYGDGTESVLSYHVSVSSRDCIHLYSSCNVVCPVRRMSLCPIAAR